MPEQQTTVTNTTDAGAWAASLDGDMKGWVEGMGLHTLPPDQALAKVLPMYRGAEQKLGVPADQLLRLPGKDAKPEDWRPIYTKLGAPEKPEDYEIKPLSENDEFLPKVLGKFHERGIPKAAAQEIVAMVREQAQAAQAADEGKWNARFEKEMQDLKREWGQEYDKHSDLSKRVQKAFGLPSEDLMAIERALGPKKFMQAFAKFGNAVGEHRFVGQGGPQAFQMSPEGAKERIRALQADPAWQKKYLSGDADSVAEFTRLQQIANPQQMAA